MRLTPDSMVIWQWRFISLNGTIIFTWVVMGLLLLISWLATRKLSVGQRISRWQNLLETIVSYMRDQIRQIAQQDPDTYLPFLGTLFLFISLSNLLTLVPLYQPPTGSLSTTAALAICVFFAVPLFGIARSGFGGYFKRYLQPSLLMLPFHVMGELSRTLALAVRLFGNIMSGTIIIAILISIVPLFVPIVMQALGLLIGQIQAYIFAVLAAVYIASASRSQQEEVSTGAREKGESANG